MSGSEGVDSKGNGRSQLPPTDPTANVLSLVEAAMVRQDDLRIAETKRIDERFTNESHHRAEMMSLEAKRIDSILTAEKDRVNALLTAAAGAVTLASTRQELTASALAERVDTSAKALATQVETTAKGLAAASEASYKALADRIVPLEQTRYENAGGVFQKREARTENLDNRAQSHWMIGAAMGIPSLILAIIAIVVLFTK